MSYFDTFVKLLPATTGILVLGRLFWFMIRLRLPFQLVHLFDDIYNETKVLLSEGVQEGYYTPSAGDVERIQECLLEARYTFDEDFRPKIRNARSTGQQHPEPIVRLVTEVARLVDEVVLIRECIVAMIETHRRGLQHPLPPLRRPPLSFVQRLRRRLLYNLPRALMRPEE